MYSQWFYVFELTDQDYIYMIQNNPSYLLKNPNHQ